MIFIDLKNLSPTDPHLPANVRWNDEDWAAWLEKSTKLVEKLGELDAAGKRQERNELIDANGLHWGKLKPWLSALSHGKCWFSDVRDLYSHYDVEHFRPKKQAKEFNGNERDGYWWLAFDHLNFRLCGTVGNRKKGGWFPLHNDSLYSTFASQCEESEACYLLDPIDEYDVSLLAFDEEGKAIPAPGTSEWDQKRVKETVKRLKLNEHVLLAEERRKIWQKVDAQIEIFYKAKNRCSAGNNPAAQQKLRDACSRIREMAAKDAELSSVAHWCVGLRADPQLSRLVG